MNLCEKGAGELVRLMKNKAVSPKDVVEAFLEKIRKENPSINAIVTLADPQKTLENPDAQSNMGKPLWGVPFTVKDVFETKGIRTTAGSKRFANYTPQEDSEVVRKLKEAGGVLLGKTNTPELALDVHTDNHLWGRTNNPINREFSAGGSSGGEAAAVAANLTAFGVGSDIGGSLRIPAHFCGVYSLKPTEGAVSGTGHIPPMPGAVNPVRALASYGPIAKNIDDLELVLDVIAKEPWERPAFKDLREAKNLSGYSFLWIETLDNLPTTEETQRAIKELVTLLEEKGARLERLKKEDFNFDEAWKVCGYISGHIFSALFPVLPRLFLRLFGRFIAKDPISRSTYTKLFSSSKSYFEDMDKRDRISQHLERKLENFDGIITPVTVGAAFKHRKTGAIHTPFYVDGVKVPGNIASTGFTSPFNLTGHPVVTIPLKKTKEGLPLGIQLVGGLWDEKNLFETARKLDRLIKER